MSRFLITSLPGLGLLISVSASFAAEPKKKPPAITLGPCEFVKTDEHLWLHFSLSDTPKEGPFSSYPHAFVQLDGIRTNFLPLVYLNNDPDELVNLVRNPQHGTRVRKMRAAMIAALRGTGAKMVDSLPEVAALPGE